MEKSDENVAKKSLREGVFPELSTAGLEALRRALVTNNPALIQGKTTQGEGSDFRACFIGFARWQGDSLPPNSDVVERDFAKKCLSIEDRLKCKKDFGDRLLAEFMAWYDSESRQEVFKALLLEVRQELAKRNTECSGERDDLGMFP